MDEMHSDAGPDRALFNQMLQEEVAPVIKHLVKLIEDQGKEIEELKHLTTAIITGFDEAMSGHRRGSLMDSISFGDDFDYDGINGAYKEISSLGGAEANDLKEDLIDYIMEQNLSDDQLQDLISTVKENARNTYGKYVKPKETAISVEVAGKPEASTEEGSEEKPEVKEESEPEKKSSGNPADDMWEKMMALHRTRSGARIKM